MKNKIYEFMEEGRVGEGGKEESIKYRKQKFVVF